jgi:hypothetical protein
MRERRATNILRLAPRYFVLKDSRFSGDRGQGARVAEPQEVFPKLDGSTLEPGAACK